MPMSAFEKVVLIGTYCISFFINDRDLRLIFISFMMIMGLLTLLRKEWKVPVESRYVSAEPVKTD
jgi:hypothetical protein